MNLYWIVAREEYNNANDIEESYAQFSFELEKRNIVFRFITLEDCIISMHPENGLQLIYKNQIIDEKITAFILSPANLNTQARAISLTLRYYLRTRGACLLNESIAGIETLEWNKIAQMSLASKVGAPILPFTMIGYHRYIIPAIKSFAANYSGEYIFKPTGTGMGFGVIKSYNLQHAISTGNLISASSIEYFMMPYLSNACDVRFFFIENELAFIELRKPKDNDYIGNVALGGEKTILTNQEFLKLCSEAPFFQDMRYLSEKILAQSGCSILSVDWLMNASGFYFNEMSTAETGLAKLPEKIRAFVFDSLTRIIHKHYAY